MEVMSILNLFFVKIFYNSPSRIETNYSTLRDLVSTRKQLDAPHVCETFLSQTSGVRHPRLKKSETSQYIELFCLLILDVAPPAHFELL